MMTPSYDLSQLKDPRDKRLATEHRLLHEFCSKTDKISYEVVGKRTPPEKYLIHYHLKSIIGVEAETQAPLYGDHHIIEISLPKGFPIEGARIYAQTDIWHPNIKWSGRYKGRVCGNLESFGKMYTLDLLVRRIGHILQYKNYHAEKEISPYPEDFEVADWVVEVAEPQGFFDKSKGIAVDPTPLVSLLKEEDDLGEDIFATGNEYSSSYQDTGRKHIVFSPPKIDNDKPKNGSGISIKKK